MPSTQRVDRSSGQAPEAFSNCRWPLFDPLLGEGMESLDLDWSWVRCGLGGGVLFQLSAV